MENTDKNIYFHVGISKTGSTFLQNRVFPRLSKITYIPTNKYHRIFEEIKSCQSDQILVSREFDRQFEREITLFSSRYRKATPIIVLRKHEEYLASQYKRFVKNGFKGEIEDFFDLENDQGFFKALHLNFSYQIGVLKEKFEKDPIVLFYEDLRSSPKAFIKAFCLITFSEINLEKVDFRKKHISYSEKQLKAIKFVSKYFNLKKRVVFTNPVLNLFWRLYQAFFRYGILYLSLIVPSFMYSIKPLISPKYLKKVGKHFKDDWENCLKYKKTDL
jgi:hypothetical protein